MTKFSFNPYHKLGSNLSPQSFRELITEKQRRIKELSVAISQAEQYLSDYPDSQPVLHRLNNLKKDRIVVGCEIVSAKHRLTELLRRLEEKDS